MYFRFSKYVYSEIILKRYLIFLQVIYNIKENMFYAACENKLLRKTAMKPTVLRNNISRKIL